LAEDICNEHVFDGLIQSTLGNGDIKYLLDFLDQISFVLSVSNIKISFKEMLSGQDETRRVSFVSLPIYLSMVSILPVTVTKDLAVAYRLSNEQIADFAENKDPTLPQNCNFTFTSKDWTEDISFTEDNWDSYIPKYAVQAETKISPLTMSFFVQRRLTHISHKKIGTLMAHRIGCQPKWNHRNADQKNRVDLPGYSEENQKKESGTIQTIQGRKGTKAHSMTTHYYTISAYSVENSITENVLTIRDGKLNLTSPGDLQSAVVKNELAPQVVNADVDNMVIARPYATTLKYVDLQHLWKLFFKEENKKETIGIARTTIGKFKNKLPEYKIAFFLLVRTLKLLNDRYGGFKDKNAFIALYRTMLKNCDIPTNSGLWHIINYEENIFAFISLFIQKHSRIGIAALDGLGRMLGVTYAFNRKQVER